MGLALDESREKDVVFENDGLTFVIEKEFFEQIKPVKIDYVESPMAAGFNIESHMPKTGGSCSTCSSCS